MRPYASAEASADLQIHPSPPVLTYTSISPTASPSGKCQDHTSCPWWPYSSAKDFKTNTAMILIFLFCALICALAFNTAIRYIMRRHRQHHQAETTESAEQKASRVVAEMEVVPSLIFSSGMKLAGGPECAICLSEFVEGDAIRVLDMCNHGFHVQCIQRWLASHPSCPTCRSSCHTRPCSSSSNDGTHSRPENVGSDRVVAVGDPS